MGILDHFGRFGLESVNEGGGSEVSRENWLSSRVDGGSDGLPS